MTQKSCSSCFDTKSLLKQSYVCGVCQCVLCKACSCFLDEETFSFFKTIPDQLKQTTYCNHCFDDQVAPALASYKQILKQARDVTLFEKGQKSIPLIKKSRIQVTTPECDDEKEVMLRLGFFAAQQSYNAVVGVEISYKKIRINGYQKTIWKGLGYPAQIRANRLRDDIG